MIKEKQHIEKKSSSSSSEGGDPSAGNDNQMIKTPDNNSGDLHHDLDSIILKNESDMTALIDNTGGDVADSKSGVGGGSASSNTSPGSSNTDQKQLMSNDICLSKIKHDDNGNNGGIKVEDNNTTSTTTTTIESDFESCDRVVLSSMGGGSGGPTDLMDGPGGVQPLMSNILGSNPTSNKQSNTSGGNMDAQQQQYMQQQSQIFVFSTSLANKSAESVLAGQYPTIIAYHCAQPRTKKFLEKHPLKVNQFNRQNPGQWMNTMVASQQQMKHQQQLNKGIAPHGQPKYGGGTPYSRAMKNSNSPSAASMDNSIMQQQSGTRMPMWNHHQGNHLNDSGPQQQLQHPSNHNMMGSMCGPGNNGIMGLSNHRSGPLGPGMLMNSSNNSNSSMIGGPGSMMNQQGNICSMGPGSGGMPINDMDLDLMDHHNPHHQHHPNPHHPSNMMDSMHRPMMGGGPHHPHHPPPHHPSGALHHRGPVGMGSGPPHHHIMPDMMMSGGPNKCQPNSMDNLMSSSSGPLVVVPSGPGNSPGSQNSLAAMMPSLVDFDDPIGSGNSSLGAAEAAAHSLTGIQVPDEELTPQQKQHRDKSRATLRKLQEILFPENPNNDRVSQQQPPPVTSSSSVGGGPLDNCSVGGMDDLMPSIDDDLDVDAIVTTAAAVTNSSSDLLLPPKTPTSCSSDWQKSIFINDDDKKKDGIRCGPPPSYHQTVARSASVPIVSVPSCSPNSPLAGSGTGVPNSNLSLPSPRTCSALNSPAGGRPSSNMSPTAVRSPGGNGSRLQSSNPGTPVHMSPGSGTGHNSCSSMKLKGPMSNEFSPSSNIATPGQPGGGGQQSPDGLYCHNKQLSKRGDEPNLMPVPSPQHIQYLNTFDGQELTIQKQPNTGLKDSSASTTTTTSTMSPSVPSSQNNLDIIMTDSNMKSSQGNTPSNHHSPSSMDMQVGNRYPSTPSDFASPSPSAMESNNGPSKQGNMQQIRNGVYTCPPSPQQQMMNDSRYPGSYGSGPQQHKPGGMMIDPKDSPLGFPSRLGPGDMPLNPSSAAAAAAAAGMQTSQQQPMKHFDPISSLAQMNQQLANNVAGGGSSPIVNHGSGVPPLHHHGGGMMSPYGGGNGPPIHMMGNNNDPMCGPMGLGSGGMHDGGISGPPGSGSRMIYGPGPGLGQGPSGPNGSGMSIGPGSGMSMGMPPIGGRNSSMMMQNCGGPMSPKSSSIMQQQQYQQQQQQRLMPRIPTGSGPGVPYNGGANIQVKPSAPNTIQYLPNNSRSGGPRGAPPASQNQQQQQQPGLDFLQRFSGGPGSGGNPLSNMDGGGKVSSHNLQYFANSGGSGGYNNSNGGPGMNDMMCGNGGPPGGGMGGIPPGGPNNSRGMMRGGPGSMIRLGGGNNGMGMVSSNYNGGPDSMFGGGGGGPPLHHPSSHSQQQQMMMMGGGSGGPPPQQHKGGGMMGGPGPPDATQPLPPSMGGGGGPGPGGGPVGFRGGPPAANSFIGPTTADPNYAQQFHNFQQQLYATNTRGAGGGGGPSGPGGGPQQFFVSK